MTRDVLQQVLRGADGFREQASTFSVESDHKVTFYLGSDARGMVVNEVDSVQLLDSYVLLGTRETGNVYCEYAMIQALSTKPPKGNAPKKAGFA